MSLDQWAQINKKIVATDGRVASRSGRVQSLRIARPQLRGSIDSPAPGQRAAATGLAQPFVRGWQATLKTRSSLTPAPRWCE